jgi:hypothetical protein
MKLSREDIPNIGNKPEGKSLLKNIILEDELFNKF